MFSVDRNKKYGWGLLRLTVLTIIAFTYSSLAIKSLNVYLQSPARFLTHAYIGSIGAIVNVKILKFHSNLILLLIAGALIVYDIWHYGGSYADYSIVAYLIKTFAGDFLAGKLDTKEWQLVLFFTFCIASPIAYYTDAGGFLPLLRMTSILFVVQLICEFGDNHLEAYVFFRHRYSFEVLNLLILFLTPAMQLDELRVVQFDIVICLFYRASNFLIILMQTDALSKFGNMLLFKFFGFYTGTPFLHVRSPELAAAILKHSTNKGNALEALIASPAWLPILSLESVDGALWSRMRGSFDLLLKKIADISVLQEIALRLTRTLVGSRHAIDAHAIARLTLETFIEYLFNQPWNDKYNVFLRAAEEWRAEISVRRKGNMLFKQQAVAFLVEELIKPSHLWAVFGDRWSQPEYYSLLMQPFIVSPVINVQDIMCAVQIETGRQVLLGNTVKPSLDQCLRALHPFPIFERFVESDLLVNGIVAVKAGTQCVMFTSDYAWSTQWPTFGGGLRSCAGQHIALPFLKVLFSKLTTSDRFDPLAGHKHSGRHNDGRILSWSEWWYFCTTIGKAFLSAKGNGSNKSA